MEEFLKTLSKPSDNVTHKDHRLEYGELSRKDLNKLCEHKYENMVDIASGPAKTLIFCFLNNNAKNIFGSEVNKERYELGISNLIKLQQYLKKDGIRAKIRIRQDHVILSCRNSGRTITYYHMSMYDPLVKQKVSEVNTIIISNVGYFYRNRHKYRDIFENIKSPKIISYKGPKFVDDQYIAHNV